ncbi:hypothetical protein BTN50_1081 [Candidatus Enterovibrio altilux]|uniref:Uncharacterized protein n=1 Tax=Candidatus Enterovibrio altilux TaxID=1927128 RepID=A0A291B992_9GAMM|nr:hypothetical protein BTN50_1081 [Candidatus Enterovibrio luxaltus]
MKTGLMNPGRFLNGIKNMHLTMRLVVMAKSLNERGLP